jgi:hypothetical protein
MRYLLLLHGDAAAEAAMSDAERRAMVDDHIAFSATMRTAGVMVAGEGLASPDTARTVRFAADGTSTVTDGPFLEAKEAIGGFYLIETASADEAARWASRIPQSPGLVVEILTCATG